MGRRGTDLRYRVFISYSHKDVELIQRLTTILRGNDLDPMWDRDLRFGEAFGEQIKNYIAHAHVFLPVLTADTSARRWVHQEIGYATALGIPVVPVVVGKVTGDREMLQSVHALEVRIDDLEPLRHALTPRAVRTLIERNEDSRVALYACADFPEARASMLARYCEDVLALGRRALVRQKGGFSSFHIPTQTIKHHLWRIRYGRVERSQEHCRLQRQERIALQKHADRAGCRLIVNPLLDFRAYGPRARLSRLECLLQFLGSMSDAKCQVATWTGMDHSESVTILGDWFLAKSASARVGQGYFQTIFTRHAPTVIEAREQFDEQFFELIREAGIRPRDSRRHAIRIVRREIMKLRARVGSGP